MSPRCLDTNRILLSVGDELAGQRGEDVAWRNMAQAGA